LIGDDSLQLPVLVLELLEPAGVTDLHVSVLLPPPIKGLLGDPDSATDGTRLSARRNLLEDPYDLLLREPALPHDSSFRGVP
jgi:hypothetical protein